jgi:hypothetical protein
MVRHTQHNRWLDGEEVCAFCCQSYLYECVFHCSACDRPICPDCVLVVVKTSGFFCPECATSEAAAEN